MGPWNWRTRWHVPPRADCVRWPARAGRRPAGVLSERHVRPAFRVYRVCPALVDSKGYSPSTKRHNICRSWAHIAIAGPAAGSELLDFRDYLPGDPPKMIAWKASARRDRLMTKEFESEVPVRCTLFVDVSSSVRVGKAGENVLARLIEIAAAVVQASAAVKDLTGLCIFEERKLRKRSGRRAAPTTSTDILGELTDVADLPLQTEYAALDQLLPLAYALAQETYPDLLDVEVNSFPFWLPWWSPQPGLCTRSPLEPKNSARNRELLGLAAAAMAIIHQSTPVDPLQSAGRHPAQAVSPRTAKIPLAQATGRDPG